ncbi:MAG TPA: sigma-70 family RNA polymerase sigma factor [Gemmatimonadaceae bacterium]|nr:sigma-70 family RNA polymerase sigma factor [Gemmatimonadaceae bacterium]
MSNSPEQPPSSTSAPDVTGLLLAWGRGDQSAADRLVPAVYDELRRQAERAMRREGGEHTLQATALVHESYLRLVDQRQVEWRNRAHFFAIASTVMRRILVDHARARLTAKRGGGAIQITLAGVEAGHASDSGDVDLLALHEALERLSVLDPDQARLVELRYFGGLTIEETAEALAVSPATVKREWALARAWLRRELSGS